MAWVVQVDYVAVKALQRFPSKDIERLKAALRDFESNPYYGDVEKLGGEQFAWRRRVGSYRIFYDVLSSQHIVFVTKIKRRGSNTY
jgi:mRNA-degrading endonuclease RelE of RelBE toxin-antitoxin system